MPAMIGARRAHFMNALFGAGLAVAPPAALLDGFESLTGRSISQGAGSLDPDGRIAGANALRLEGLGVSGQTPQSFRTFTGLDPATMGTIACHVRVNRELQLNSFALQFGRSGGSYADVCKIATGMGAFGGYWLATHASEIAGLQTLGPGAFDVKQRMFQNGPFNSSVTVDHVMLNAGGRAAVMCSFDDWHNTMFTEAEPYMTPRGVPGQGFLVSGGPVGLGSSTGLTMIQAQALYAKGWEFGIDSPDDSPYTNFADVPTAVAAANGLRQMLVDYGMPRGKDFGCWPNTSISIVPTDVKIAAMTRDSSNPRLVSFYNSSGTAITADVANGMTLDAYGVAAGITVESGGGSGVNTVTLSADIPAGTIAARFSDKSGPFYPGKLTSAFRSAGMKLMRGGGGSQIQADYDVLTRFGFSTQDMYIPALSVGLSSFETVKAAIDKAILRGTTIILLFHRIGGTSGFDTSVAIFRQIIDYIAAKRAANVLDPMTMSQLYARDADGAASLPLAA